MDHWLRAYGQLRSSFLQIFQWSRANILSLEKSIYSSKGPCGPWVGAICGCTRDTLCRHLVTCVKITKSWVGLRVRNSDFPCVHSPYHGVFTSFSCERITLNSLFCSYCSWASPCWLCGLEAGLPRAPVWAQVSCGAGFPHELRRQRPHGPDLRGQPGSILTVTDVK